MSAPLDELYLEWLYGEVADPNIQGKTFTYWKVLKVLLDKPFAWVPDIVNDENRIADGKALRLEFFEEKGISDPDQDWVELGCSFLELMVGLARRLAFVAGGEPHYWFWFHLMENIGLAEFTDNRRLPKRRVDDVLNEIIFRNYEPSGLGGFFPLQYPREDQRTVELWTQLNEYVLEQQELAG
jgi:hypothetical protein